MNSSPVIQSTSPRTLVIRESYCTALHYYQGKPWFARISWVSWIITIVTVATWCFTAWQVALAAGAQGTRAIIASVLSNAENSDVLIAYGAKDNELILRGQYWRFITPIFLHANLLHIGLNMLNFLILGIIIERIFGHLRFLLLYLVTGIISVIASFYFEPQEIAVGASGAIFGIVGIYSAFVLMHRRALRANGIPALLWLVLVIGVNLGIDFVIPNVDNYAHISGLLSGCLLGWIFTPYYVPASGKESARLRWLDTHRLARRWPLAVVTIVVTLLLAIMALRFAGG